MGVVLGILKVGRRRLFLNVSRLQELCARGTRPLLSLQDGTGVQHEVEPLSVLDFYVHESRQRSGCGKKLFEAMMEVQVV